ncbi:enoyl-CoA hydratase-related protein [Embleya sp. NPDC005971]|uniref:enoyl-CoA hydratase-related protein n=1 Tax=Embleya sp. NPDC005971 TaxID=3156724 RepID=UPI0033C07297
MTVTTERRGRVLVVAIDREAKRNAIDQRVADGIEAALDLLEDDPELWVGVLTGTSTVFSAGTDLAAGLSPKGERGGEYGVIRRQRTKPLIAAVEGFALGGGFEIVLACDLVVASAAARFGLPEVKRGLMAICGGTFRAPRALPLNLAREMLLVGDPLPAERLYQVGVVNRLTEPGQALAGAVELAERICANGPVAVRASLAAVEHVVAADDEAGWAGTETGFAAIVASEDMKEGVAAFLAKRAPEWTGR